ncbi:hypothetical protein NDU88_005558 [Pleurodeles waltl]|uniref:Selenoprotein P N-terminal domain-containing protein n=1 Tax=Pleurodeles waltl TaxID=8319 RepID=A0AAV7WBC5_PLEWA|nr:hypothetical protein NDU88_005558 [Pleurodeles waltl]
MFTSAAARGKRSREVQLPPQCGEEGWGSSWLSVSSQASRLEELRLKLEKDGLVNISYIVVNHQGKPSQLKYHLLKERVSENISVYQQDETQPDIWSLLNGNKDDFLVYDRCGRLVSHLGLPYTFLSFPYVEESIRIAYCENKCGICNNTIPIAADVCNTTLNVPTEGPTEEHQPEEPPTTNNARPHDPAKHRGHGHQHPHHERDHLSEDKNHQGSVHEPVRHSHNRNRHYSFLFQKRLRA